MLCRYLSIWRETGKTSKAGKEIYSLILILLTIHGNYKTKDHFVTLEGHDTKLKVVYNSSSSEKEYRNFFMDVSKIDLNEVGCAAGSAQYTRDGRSSAFHSDESRSGSAGYRCLSCKLKQQQPTFIDGTCRLDGSFDSALQISVGPALSGSTDRDQLVDTHYKAVRLPLFL